MIKLDRPKARQLPKGQQYLTAEKLVSTYPLLCHMKLHDMNIENKPGGCHICVVEISGQRNLAPACCTKVSEGSIIQTHSMRVINARRTVMELLSSPIIQLNVWPVPNRAIANYSMAHRLGIREIHCQENNLPHKMDNSPFYYTQSNKLHHVPALRNDCAKCKQ